MHELVAPHEESIDLVDEWLASYGIAEEDFTRSPARDWIKVTVPVWLAEEMLDTVSDANKATVNNALSQICRNITYGNTQTEIQSSELLVTVYLPICTNTSISSNRRRYSPLSAV